ncbi:SAM-dependent methyltransferase [Amycolatopsis sp. GM8]|uniref:SAM-dependent methyltransferase n=1 Tax=Amycolatopsis sp. GM8 TaxID=2896530 RepID=UPI001F465911|nr:SAM-dependent methyltransferase [Amycolatopsis sp. GM8]
MAEISRVRDAALDGKDNYADDRALLAELEAAVPSFRELVRAQHRWHGRAVRYLAGQGFGQFLHCGVGLPVAVDNTHEIVQRHNLDGRVVYTEADRAIVAHGRALLEDDETFVVQADYTCPDEFLPAVAGLLDFSLPIAVLHIDTLHHIDDDAQPVKIMTSYLDALAPGSAVALSHWWDPDDERHEQARALEATWQARCPHTGRFRRRAEIEALLTGLELLEPGLAELDQWWPDGPALTPPALAQRLGLAAIGLKP